MISTVVKRTTPGMRVLLWVAGGLVFLAGMQLFVFPERTEDYFAWTIDEPLTAVFLGAGYWASVVFEWVAARERTWAYARVTVPSVFTFTTLTLVATLIHIENFHLGSEFELSTRAVTWAWIAVYAVVPVLMLVVLLRQRRAPGGDPPRTARLPRWIAAVLFLHAAVMLSVGIALFVAPEEAASMWPWALTPLTGRAIGAWVISFGLAAAHSLWERDLRRLRVAAAGYIALGVLETIAALRYPDSVEWDQPQALVYAAILASMIVVGVAAATGGRAARDSGPL
ncbi:MAG: hypothetical protein ACRDKZ_04265 [Actinomycetota bacterium]